MPCMNPFDNPRENLDFPQHFELRIIMDAGSAARGHSLLSAVLAGLGCAKGSLESRPSDKPRYARLAVAVRVEDKAAMARLYEAVSAVEGVRFVL